MREKGESVEGWREGVNRMQCMHSYIHTYIHTQSIKNKYNPIFKRLPKKENGNGQITQSSKTLTTKPEKMSSISSSVFKNEIFAIFDSTKPAEYYLTKVNVVQKDRFCTMYRVQHKYFYLYWQIELYTFTFYSVMFYIYPYLKMITVVMIIDSYFIENNRNSEDSFSRHF